MTRLTTRPALTSLAVAAGLLLAGCSAGQVAETARKSPSVPGVNAEKQLRDSGGAVVGSVAVRDVLVAYKDPAGYQRGGEAPLEARVFNDTMRTVTVTVLPARPQPDSGQVVTAESVGLVGTEPAGATPSASDPATPDAGAQAARFDIPAGGFAVLSQASGHYLRLIGLAGPLVPGMSVPVLFRFSNGPELTVTVPMANPLSAEPRATAGGEEPLAEL